MDDMPDHISLTYSSGYELSPGAIRFLIRTLNMTDMSDKATYDSLVIQSLLYLPVL